MNASSSRQIERVRDLIKGFSTAMLITHSPDGELRARPMAIAGVDEDLSVWFFTSQDCAKVHEIEADTRVHISFQRDNSSYLSISGAASVVRDRQKAGELWKEPFRVWFPDGKDDPNLVLISFHPHRAEFWDNSGFNKVSYLWQTAKAYITNDTPEIHNDSDQHGVVMVA